MSKRTKNRIADVPLMGLDPEPPPFAALPTIITAPPVATLKLDLGCGRNPAEGFEGVDQYQMDGKVKHVVDLRKPWPWPDSSVAEARASHFLEHLTNFNDKWERVHFFNELYRVLINGGTCQIIIPHWCSNRYYGDPSHAEPFSEMGFYYLDRNWRKTQTPAVDAEYAGAAGYSCDFIATWGYNMHPELVVKSQDVQAYWMQWYKEACQDLIATVTARK